jgi:hypothetical protein
MNQRSQDSLEENAVPSKPNADRTEGGDSNDKGGPPPVVEPDDDKSPPRTPLVLHVGVTGHRPDPLKRPSPNEEALRETIREVLSRVQDACRGVARSHRESFTASEDSKKEVIPRLRVISSLAEGADQWVAEEAMGIGYELQAPLPFARAVYQQENFAPGSPAAANLVRLLGSADTVFELDGDPNRSGDSYHAAGRVMLNQSDILLAIWDGKDAKGTGGTGQIVREAIEGGIPVVWIKWTDPKTWELLEPKWRLVENLREMEGDWDRLTRLVQRILLPPKQPFSARLSCPPDLWEKYFREKRKRCWFGAGIWNAFRNLVGWSKSNRLDEKKRDRPKEEAPGFWMKIRNALLRLIAPTRPFFPSGKRLDCSATIADWKKKRTRILEELRGVDRAPQFPAADWADKLAGPHYAWANFLSVCYGGFYRSSYLCNYFLGAAAVFLALLGFLLGFEHGGWVWGILAEAVLIGIILGLTWRGTRKRWHERWIDYRTLAERLRLLRFLALLGGSRQPSSIPSHLATYGNPANTWMFWHFRAVERALGLPTAVVNETYLQKAQKLLSDDLVFGQEEYHSTNARRMANVDHRLHRCAAALFVLTFLACAAHLLLEWFAHEASPAWLMRALVFANAAFPALGAALAAIKSHGEFHRIGQRSAAMVEELRGLKLDLNSVSARTAGLCSVRIRETADQIAELMVDETLDWRIVFKDRPLTLPT